ncbi:cytochrome c [Pseudomonas sp. 21LCFQ010]|uniref:c-type cytochrome n=1 Tax=unclassified Pseudomonas TaxID=196821 RepID=UPI0004F84254|nr:cytochrome c [Pseudomonas sp. StFLB209]MCO8166086.1 cytochrome c [Pseudomonas sp. 21LCFQ010]BAP41331.1 membrane-bound D-gluconate 2-dehydrogenase cytochrome c subunit [Pseudomonas sp. StFLB209]
MKSKSRSLLLTLVVLGVVLALLGWLVAGLLNRSGDATAQLTQPVTPELIKKGEYLARAGDCVACHTAHGGKEFAGGRGIESPIGTIYATNITPDKDTGIGGWTYGQFEQAVRRGINHDGTALYPAMPFPSYARTSDEDTQALYAYFMNGVAPVKQANKANDIPWPLSIRWPLAYWRTLFSPLPEDAAVSLKVSTDGKDPQIARGAYLVQGLGHCGSCHTPRALTMQERGLDEKSATYLAGGELNGWSVPSLRGMPHWTQEELVDYLGTGRNAKASVGGEMTDVIANSTSHMTDADLHAIAAYLKSLPASQATYQHDPQRSAATAAKLTAAKDLTLGERLYLDNCGACHFVAGEGASRVFPRLDGATIINADNPTALIHVILAGTTTPSTARAPAVLPMPGFAWRMDDSETAALVSFLRQGWSNNAGAVTANQVRDIRANLNAGHDTAKTTLEPSKPQH